MSLASRFGLGVLLLAAGSVGAFAQSSSLDLNKKPEIRKIRRVYLNVTGDERLANVYWTYLEFELEDGGFQVVDSPKNADAEIDVHLEPSTATEILTLGVIKGNIRAGEKTVDFAVCGALSSGTGSSDLFDGAGWQVAKKIREAFPNAHSVLLDPASDNSLSVAFANQLPAKLEEEKLSASKDRSSDVLLRTILVKQPVPVLEDVIKYSVLGVDQRGQFLKFDNSAVRTARLKGDPPSECPDRFEDFEWLRGSSSLFSSGTNVLRMLHIRNGKVPTF